MKRANLLLTILFLCLGAKTILAGSAERRGGGVLFGRVTDSKTGLPLADCRVRLFPGDTVVTTDSSGRFEAGGLLPGAYRALFVKPGFEALEQANIMVGTGMAEEVRARLSPLDETMELAEVTTRAKAGPNLGRGNDPAGTVRFGRNDVLRAPGALQDISMFAQTIPGVARTDDQATDLSVRGGRPDENAYLIDGIPIFNINHFEDNSRSNGGIGNINAYFLDAVDFHTGAFSARYPDGLSSVLDISFKRGNPTRHSGMATADVAGLGGLLEGPIPGSGAEGTYGATFRVSSLSFLDQMGIIDFGAVPRYGNGHVKVNWLTGPWDVSLNVLGGVDGYDSRVDQGMAPLRPGQEAMYRHKHVQVLYTGNLFGGVRATRNLEGARLSVYTAGNLRHYDWREGVDRTLSQGPAESPREADYRYGKQTDGSRVLWGADGDWFPASKLTLRAGLLHHFDRPEQTLFEDNRVTLADGSDTASQEETYRTSSWYNAALYGEAEWNSGPWNLTGGARLFYDEYVGRAFVGPRASIRRRLGGSRSEPGTSAPGGHALKAAVGLHTQSPAGDYFSAGIRPGWGHLPYNVQGVLGWDADWPLGLFTRVELFDKQSYRILRSDYRRNLRDTGRTYSRGLDFFVRKALRAKAWGSASYTFAWNRSWREGEWRRHDYSIPHSFSTALGYDFSRNLTTSVRLGMASGTPYTPLTNGSESSTTSPDPSLRFTGRTDTYFRLDTRVEYRRPFPKATLGMFLEITNLTDQENFFAHEEYELEPGWGFLPVGGLTLSF